MGLVVVVVRASDRVEVRRIVLEDPRLAFCEQFERLQPSLLAMPLEAVSPPSRERSEASAPSS